MRTMAGLFVLASCTLPLVGACTLDAHGTSATDAQGGAAGNGGGGDAVCGDTLVDVGEDCDDGNSAPGDGCGASCRAEDPNQCDGAPILIAFGATIERNGDTTGASDKVNTAANIALCPGGSFAGVDLIYAVQPGGDGMLTTTLRAGFGRHYLHTRTACPGTTGDEVSCDYSQDPGTPDVNTMPVARGQTHYVIVDSYYGDAGQFKLTLTLGPAP